MRILHLCLAATYVDRYGYQENILPRAHKAGGHDVMILASTESLEAGKGHVYLRPSDYLNEDGIPVRRIPYVRWLPAPIARKVRAYRGVGRTLEEFRPDVIFMHDAQTAAVHPVCRYCREHPQTRLYIDSHTDSVNSARGWFSRNILHGILYRSYVQCTIPFTRRYYGTLPARVEFYRDFYGTPAARTTYLPFGVDDISVPRSRFEGIRRESRGSFGLKDGDFVIVTGGKIEKRKNTLALMEAFKALSPGHPDARLLIFGEPDAQTAGDFRRLAEGTPGIICAGWVKASETCRCLLAGDLACFPGTHSTLWEESAGYGLPGLYRKWEGMGHIDLGGNARLLDGDADAEEIRKAICEIMDNPEVFKSMKEAAMKLGPDYFSYSRIARDAINT